MTGQGDKEAQATVAADQVLSSVSNELRVLTDMTEQLQFDISELLKENSNIRSLRVYQLQNLDHITQVLASLASFMEAIAVGVPGDWSVDAANAARKIPLADLSSRLSHNADEDDAAPREGTSGDVALF